MARRKGAEMKADFLLLLPWPDVWWKWPFAFTIPSSQLNKSVWVWKWCCVENRKLRFAFAMDDATANFGVLGVLLFRVVFFGQREHLWQNTRRQMSERGRANTSRSLPRAKQPGSKVQQRAFKSVVFTFFFLRHFTSNLGLRKQEGKGWKKGLRVVVLLHRDQCGGSVGPHSQTYLDNNSSQLEPAWGGGPEGCWLDRVSQPLHDLWLPSVCHKRFSWMTRGTRQADWGKTCSLNRWGKRGFESWSSTRTLPQLHFKRFQKWLTWCD